MCRADNILIPAAFRYYMHSICILFRKTEMNIKIIKIISLKYALLLIPVLCIWAFTSSKTLLYQKILVSPDSTPGIEQIEKQAFYLVNEHRKSIDLRPLVNKDYIAEQARQHSKDMADGKVVFGHDGANDRLDIISKSLKEISGGGENVFYCTGNYDNLAATAVEAWLKSPGHRENIEGDYNLSGMGVVQAANGDYYFTQIFVKGTE